MVSKWIWSTIAGLIPFIMRIIVFGILTEDAKNYDFLLYKSDFVISCLIMNFINLSELSVLIPNVLTP